MSFGQTVKTGAFAGAAVGGAVSTLIVGVLFALSVQLNVQFFPMLSESRSVEHARLDDFVGPKGIPLKGLFTREECELIVKSASSLPLFVGRKFFCLVRNKTRC